MLEINFSPFKNKKVAVALSGGADSVALFTLFCENADTFGISLSAINVEHGIRGEESREDTEFVRALCEKAGIPLSVFRADIPALAKEQGTGLEEAARKYRQDLFIRTVEAGKADFVATAHHAGDNAESVLFNLFRGCALTGACGIRSFIPIGGGGIVRPLLRATKAEILSFLKERGICWREDSTNADTAYTRNFIRKKILSPAKEIFPECEKNISSFAGLAREDDEYLYSLTDRYVREGEEFFISSDAPRPVFLRCCMRAFRYFGGRKDYTLAAAEEIWSLRERESGAGASLPFGLCAVNDYGKIVVFRPEKAKEFCYPFSEGEFDCGKYLLRVKRGVPAEEGKKLKAQEGCRRLFASATRFPEGAVIRQREEGDLFRKFGGGTKKLKEFFIDRKIPARMRDLYPLIAAGKEIFAVCGVEISAKVAAERGEDGSFCDPQNVYELTLSEKEQSRAGRY